MKHCSVARFILAAAGVLATSGIAAAQVQYDTLHAFAGGAGPAHPYGLVLADNGNFYGTTQSGGPFNSGTVFRVTPAGAVTVLYSFTGGIDGRSPSAGLILADDGNLYGTTDRGGTFFNGTVFKISLTGSLAVLHSFAPNSFRGSGRLVQAANRDLYGTSFTNTDGTGGTAFRITLGGTFTTVHTFRGNAEPWHNGDPADGYAPSELIRGPDGNLYGTSAGGGAFRMGTVFRMTPDGAVTLLHSFSQDAAGFNPCSLLLASDGNLYGRSCLGGGSDRGTLFKLTLSGVVTVLHDFAVTEGRWNGYSLTQGRDGFLYGSTETVIFRATTDGAFSALHTLAGNSLPRGALVQGTDGRFYGTTLYGGDFLRGQFLSLDAAGTVTTLHAFRPGPDGSSPNGTPVEGPDGALYGTTELGGLYDRGVAFRLAPDGTYSVLHTFVGGSADGEGPFGLILGSDGNLYGSTTRGGISDDGTIFRMTPGGEVTILHHFAGAPSDGAYGAFLATAADGSFYGVTRGGGAFDGGTAFRMTAGTVTILHHFAGGMSDGAYPGAVLVQASDGNFYGTTSYGGVRGYGTIFRMTANGEVTVLHSLYAFDGDYSPLGVPGLRLGADGNLYGTVTSNIKGGARGSEVFRVTLDGRYTVLHAFDHSVEGFPVGALELASDGNLYGWSRTFFNDPRFEIFRIAPTGVYTAVYTDATGTGHPSGRLIQASDGHLYGVRNGGGARVDAWGTLFRVRGVECPYSHTASPSQLVASGSGGAHVITINTRPGCSWTPSYRAVADRARQRHAHRQRHVHRRRGATTRKRNARGIPDRRRRHTGADGYPSRRGRPTVRPLALESR